MQFNFDHILNHSDASLLSDPHGNSPPDELLLSALNESSPPVLSIKRLSIESLHSQLLKTAAELSEISSELNAKKSRYNGTTPVVPSYNCKHIVFCIFYILVSRELWTRFVFTTGTVVKTRPQLSRLPPSGFKYVPFVFQQVGIARVPPATNASRPPITRMISLNMYDKCLYLRRL